MNPSWLDWPQTQILVKAFPAETLRFVGGAVRDALLGRDVQDVDAATVLLPDETMKLLEKSGIRAIPTGIDHGTVTAVINGKSFEITTLRRDVATDGRHATVAFTDDWKEDAARRDFTMNALYLSPTGELFDYFGGTDDAHVGRVRFIGDAAERISEDHLRILRYFRFYAHYGQGKPDDIALAACAAQASHITTLSGERIQHEMFKLLQAPSSFATLKLMQEKAILLHILGFTIAGCSIFSRFDAIAALEQCAIPPVVRLIGFVITAAIAQEKAMEQLALRLRLSNQAQRLMRSVLQHYRLFNPQLSLAEQKRLIRKLGDDIAWVVIMNWASRADGIDAQHPYHEMLKLAAVWQPPMFPIGGDDLIALGLKPGKGLGELLAKLEEEWESSEYKLTKEELLARSRPSPG